MADWAKTSSFHRRSSRACLQNNNHSKAWLREVSEVPVPAKLSPKPLLRNRSPLGQVDDPGADRTHQRLNQG